MTNDNLGHLEKVIHYDYILESSGILIFCKAISRYYCEVQCFLCSCFRREDIYFSAEFDSDSIFFSCRSSDQLDVEAFYLVAADSFAAQVGLYDFDKFVVDDVAEGVVVGVVEMDVLECVNVEVHLVVCAEAVAVDAEHCHMCQYVIYGCYRYFSFAFFLYEFCDHIGAGMS